jgi:hypothetical protein
MDEIKQALDGLAIPDLQNIVIKYCGPETISGIWRVSRMKEFSRLSFGDDEGAIPEGMYHFDLTDLPSRLAKLGVAEDVDCSMEAWPHLITIITQNHRLDFPATWYPNDGN